MRKAPGKQYGYIVLPVAIPDGVDPANALDDNETETHAGKVVKIG